MIELSDISVTFESGVSETIRAIENLDLVLPKGQFVTVIGANGSGKSTLLNVISGNIRPDKGRIVISGNDVTGERVFQRARWISRMFQDPLAGTAGRLTVIDNLRLASLRTKSKSLKIGVDRKFRDHASSLLAETGLGLENRLDIPVSSLSGGQRQALTLVMAVIDESYIILMDEPTSALDPSSSRTIMDLVERFISKFGMTAILVTHNMQDALKYGDRLLMLESGHISHDLDLQEKRDLDISSLYNWFGQAGG